MSANIVVKILVKKILLVLLAIAGYIVLLPFWPGRRKNKLVILRYHSVGDFRAHEVNVKVAAFREQMGYLKRFYKPVSLSQGVAYLREGKGISEGSVAVTFDDGYKDNLMNAYPILRELGIPASIFLTAGYIGTEKTLPHDEGDDPLHNGMLSWSDVREMSGGGTEFGSHTLSHANLGKANIGLEREITESKKLIERELRRDVRAISYPFGLIRDFTGEAKRAAREAGYTTGLSAMNGVNDSKTDIFSLRRIGVEASDNMFTFRAKLNGALDLLIIKDRALINGLLRVFNRALGV